MNFTILHESRSTNARVGRVETPHGGFDTPAFMPVGTSAAVKGVTVEQLRAVGARILLANAYHLMLRPGHELVEQLGGLHAFMGWDGPILTDSGGYQVMSLAKSRSVGDEGVRFRSHLDGSEISEQDLDLVRDTVWKHLVVEPWEVGDVIAIDNFTTFFLN